MVEVEVIQSPIGRSDAGCADDISIFNDIILCFLFQLLKLQLLLVGQLLLVIDHLEVFLQLLVERFAHVSELIVKS
jgi:hypothetical protein